MPTVPVCAERGRAGNGHRGALSFSISCRRLAAVVVN